MAGSLIKLDEKIASSDASITVGGSNWDSSYDVYMVKLSNIVVSAADTQFYARFTVPTPSAGTPDTSANYDRASKRFFANSAFTNFNGTNETNFYATAANVGSGTGKAVNNIMYLFNFNNASEYSFYTIENTQYYSSNQLTGIQGGGVLTVAQATDGVQFYTATGNISSGVFTLYGLKK